jgi:hypothetical protein
MRGSKDTNPVHPSDLKFPRYEGIKRDQSSSLQGLVGFMLLNLESTV